MKIIRFLAFGMCLLILPLAAFAVDITIGMKGGVGFPFYSGSDYESALAGIATTKVGPCFSAGDNYCAQQKPARFIWEIQVQSFLR